MSKWMDFRRWSFRRLRCCAFFVTVWHILYVSYSCILLLDIRGDIAQRRWIHLWIFILTHGQGVIVVFSFLFPFLHKKFHLSISDIWFLLNHIFWKRCLFLSSLLNIMWAHFYFFSETSLHTKTLVEMYIGSPP